MKATRRQYPWLRIERAGRAVRLRLPDEQRSDLARYWPRLLLWVPVVWGAVMGAAWGLYTLLMALKD